MIHTRLSKRYEW